ncbi:MAG: GatB/YqeY domain-containing protein [Bacteroidia bacterium]
MMIEEKLNADIKTAMLARDAKKLEALRAMKSVVLLLKTSPEGLTEDSANKALQKEVKKRRESADIYNQQNRADLAEVETAQTDVIEAYLPKQLSAEEIKAEVEKVIAQVGATSPADMGKVMGAATKALAGKADGKIVSEMVKQLLAK